MRTPLGWERSDRGLHRRQVSERRGDPHPERHEQSDLLHAARIVARELAGWCRYGAGWTNGGSDRIASRFEVGRESFRWNGRRFSATDVSPRPPSDDGLFQANIEGQLSRDGDRASGRADATVIWFDTINSSRVTCESGPVRWSVQR